MKFQQLRYLVAVHENGLNITAAARQLHTSQPGVSRQLKLLEEELGFQLFEREGRALTRTTAAGEEIIIAKSGQAEGKAGSISAGPGKATVCAEPARDHLHCR